MRNYTMSVVHGGKNAMLVRACGQAVCIGKQMHP